MGVLIIKSVFTETFLQHSSSKLPSILGAEEFEAIEIFVVSRERTLTMFVSTGLLIRVDVAMKGMSKSLNIAIGINID